MIAEFKPRAILYFVQDVAKRRRRKGNGHGSFKALKARKKPAETNFFNPITTIKDAFGEEVTISEVVATEDQTTNQQELPKPRSRSKRRRSAG